ncbi:predicted protein [Naegleria gruberi]|uniref:Predicted protein n=1 Tax=Naegleria gruberi TaxID=5762 RepID=D2V5B2_NAEGR|nr:uncharacterized protein NAEGRDRAFT_64078 [Naegleria gruberi]EFC48244.1 predicted protein [Naegleria gruberi]|eukprot:XP_002680988.1 predicted protein [Naegleria gruberi strain NEG-M]
MSLQQFQVANSQQLSPFFEQYAITPSNNIAALLINSYFQHSLMEPFSMLSDNSTLNFTTNNTKVCDSSLIGTPWIREMNVTSQYGLCNDTYFAFATCLAFMIVYIITVLLTGVGVFWKRKSSHVEARSPIYLAFTLCAAFFFIVGMTLRIVISRRLFPCGLLTICFFTFPAAVTLPTIFRLMRAYFMYKINLQKTKLFESPTNLQNTSTTNTGGDNTSGNIELKQAIDNFTIETQSGTQQQQFFGQEDGIVKRQERLSRVIAKNHEYEPQLDSINGTTSNTVTDDDDESNFDTDNDSQADVSTWNMSEYKDLADVQKELRKLKIFNFLISVKFITVIYILSFLFGVIIWLIVGVAEEAIYNTSTDPNKKRIFLNEGGILLFSHGCGMNTTTTIMISVESILFILLELVFLIFAFTADRDSWGIKRETMILIVIQLTSAILFVVAANIDFIASVTDAYFPYGFILWGYMFIEVIVCVTIPVIRSIIFDKKLAKNTESESGLEKVLKNRKMFKIVLEFARRSYCTESVLCWRDIQRFKKAKRSQRKKAVNHIVNAYMTVGAPLELNMPKITFKSAEILEQVKQIESTNGKIPTDIFKAVQDHCLNDMADLFDRLKNSNNVISDFVKNYKKASTYTESKLDTSATSSNLVNSTSTLTLMNPTVTFSDQV